MMTSLLLLQLIALAKVGELAMSDPEAKKQAREILNEAVRYAEK